ncbi:MAG: SOS response-associated peptidase [Clostridiaceae bacterium]|nr:SOS response-associated peptidase [Clostridiaceae bacterium]
MCGRYSVMTEEDILEMREILEEINRRYAGDPRLAELRTGEIFPTHTVPVLATARDGGTQPGIMRWGFPRPQGSGVVINARSETVMEKRMFRSAFFTRRCVIPSTGFYEWKHEPGRKQKDKMLLRLPEQPMLYMAGLYGFFPDARDPDGGGHTGFVILTTQANESVAPIHDRMPLVLSADELEPWLYTRSAAEALVSSPCGHLLSAVPA